MLKRKRVIRKCDIMELNKDTCYKIVQAKDARFDGVFFLAVESTKIYCRPICKVPPPKKENCKYYNSAVEAESLGYRPCLRCRPEMAPDYSEFAQKDNLLNALLDYFRVHDYQAGIIGKAGAYFGISSRHINRLFHDVLGVAPKDYLMTKRLLRGKALLTDTNLSITKVSELSGFGSPSRFSAALKKHYRLTPSAMRKQNKSSSEFICLYLYYRPPYLWELMMNFLKDRAIPHVEKVTDEGVYRRSLKVEKNGTLYLGWIEVSPLPDACKVAIKISNSLEEVILTVIQKIRQVFDLDLDPRQFPKNLNEGVRLPGCFDGFEVACRAIIGQQVTVKAATTLSGRLTESIGTKAVTPWKDINRYFPTAKEIDCYEDIVDVMGKSGIIGSRSETIERIAKQVVCGKISFKTNQNIEEMRENLNAIKGIGPWSTEYIIMRGISWPDAFPVSDLVIKNKLLMHLADEDGVKLTESVNEHSKYTFNKKYEKAAKGWIEQYHPWSSYITMGIWNDLLDWS